MRKIRKSVDGVEGKPLNSGGKTGKYSDKCDSVRQMWVMYVQLQEKSRGKRGRQTKSESGLEGERIMETSRD